MKLSSIVLAATFLFPSFALASEFECVVTKGKGPFSDRLLISFTDDTVVVDGGYIRHFEGKPVTGEKGEYSDKKKVAKWRVAATNNSGQTTRLAYRGVILANGKFILTAKPHGYANVFNGRGRCRALSGAS